jgi:lipid-A-disaccharide synthase
MDAADAGLRLGMVAGEASGDLLASSLLQGLAARLGGAASIRAAGIGGPAMAASGFDAWWPTEALSVRGYAEVLASYPRLRAIRNRLTERLLHWRPEVFVGVDSSDFNLDMEARLRQGGIPVAHFVGPSIWAWRANRIERIRRSVDHMLLVFPFEKKLYDEAGIAATYVGHPLADRIPPRSDAVAARALLGLPADATVVAVLPGSRAAEVRYIAPAFIDTIRWLASQRQGLSFIVPAATDSLYQRLRTMLAEARLPDGIDCRLVMGQSHAAMAAADVVLTASGTATLEVALHGRPMVIAYRMAWATYLLIRNRGYLPWIGLPNILCNDSVVPEFIQAAATPEAMGRALLAQLDDAPGRERLQERFAALHETLRRDCGARAAEVVLALRDASRSRHA